MKLVFGALFVLLASSALAARVEMTPDEVVSKGRALSATEVEALVRGAAVTRYVHNGSTQNWTNALSGNMDGLRTDAKGQGGAARGGSGTGNWTIEEARFCISPSWRAGNRFSAPLTECLTLYDVKGKYIGIEKSGNLEGFEFTTTGVGKTNTAPIEKTMP